MQNLQKKKPHLSPYSPVSLLKQEIELHFSTQQKNRNFAESVVPQFQIMGLDINKLSPREFANKITEYARKELCPYKSHLRQRDDGSLIDPQGNIVSNETAPRDEGYLRTILFWIATLPWLTNNNSENLYTWSPEDWPKLQDDLYLFGQLKQKKSITALEKNICIYKTPQELLTALDLYRITISRANRLMDDADEWQKSHPDEAIVLWKSSHLTPDSDGHKRPRLRIIHLKTETASRIYGKDTKWCTSYQDKPTSFSAYSDGLILLHTSNGERHLLHLRTASFKNELDKSASFLDVASHNRDIIPVLTPFLTPRVLGSKFNNTDFLTFFAFMFDSNFLAKENGIILWGKIQENLKQAAKQGKIAFLLPLIRKTKEYKELNFVTAHLNTLMNEAITTASENGKIEELVNLRKQATTDPDIQQYQQILAELIPETIVKAAKRGIAFTFAEYADTFPNDRDFSIYTPKVLENLPTSFEEYAARSDLESVYNLLDNVKGHPSSDLFTTVWNKYALPGYIKGAAESGSSSRIVAALQRSKATPEHEHIVKAATACFAPLALQKMAKDGRGYAIAELIGASRRDSILESAVNAAFLPTIPQAIKSLAEIGVDDGLLNIVAAVKGDKVLERPVTEELSRYLPLAFSKAVNHHTAPTRLARLVQSTYGNPTLKRVLAGMDKELKESVSNTLHEHRCAYEANFLTSLPSPSVINSKHGMVASIVLALRKLLSP